MIRVLTVAAALFIAVPAWADDAVPPPAPAKPFVYTAKASDIVIGKNDAPVTVVEYASLSCPHCAHFFTQVLPDLTTKYIDTGKIRMVYRDYPLNEPALKAAELVQCADKDRRHDFLNVLFKTQGKWAYDANFRESLANIALLGGMERAQFNACLDDKEREKSVVAVAKEAQDDYKVSSTPTFYINGNVQQGDAGLEALSKTIDDALAKTVKK